MRNDWILDLDRRLTETSTNAWEWLLRQRASRSKANPALEYLSEADRIEAEQVGNGAPITLYAILLLIIVSIIWASLSSIDQVVVAKGQVTSNEQNIILQPQETAQIKEIRVKVGQKVLAGTPLILLDPTLTDADLKQTQAAYQGTLQALELSRSELRTVEARVQAAQETERMTEKLVERNFQSRKALIDQRERRLELEQALIAIKARQNDLLSQKNGYEQQLIKAKHRAGTISIESPRDAVVLEVSNLTVGSVARATEPLVTLVPTDVPIVIEAGVTPADIAAVKVGQDVRIKVDAFPFQRHGYLTGRVQSVSPDAVGQKGASETRIYKLRIDFSTHVEESELRAKLIPGMTLTAEVIAEKRTILRYLFDPLVQIKEESLRER